MDNGGYGGNVTTTEVVKVEHSLDWELLPVVCWRELGCNGLGNEEEGCVCLGVSELCCKEKEARQLGGCDDEAVGDGI